MLHVVTPRLFSTDAKQKAEIFPFLGSLQQSLVETNGETNETNGG